ncbi:MAG: zinc-dependent alcohol dehydrogenase family protein [Cyanobacteria bacterium SZAS LIN-5]|nr:zinc-dependent alcohol dehydrogenase family protein [Cyanobacteria bacterium SZAS LIN-5]
MPRVVRFHNFGGPEVLKIENIEIDEPGENEVKIKVEAIGLNRAEIVFREGKYLERDVDFPSRIGYEAAGVVEAVGAKVTNCKVGDKVSTIPSFSMAKYGVYGDTAVVPATAVAHYPDHLSTHEATSIWMQYLTAYGALIEFGNTQPGDFVVITAASSSVGFAAIQIVKEIGATSIATTRSAAKKQALLDAGADHVVVTDEEDLERRVHQITKGKGSRVIFDAVAGTFLKDLADLAAPEATIFIYGALSMMPTPFPLMMALKKGLVIRGYTLFQITGRPDRLERAKKYVIDGLTSGKLKPVLDKTFTLDQIAEAHRHMQSNEQIGKIIVSVN